MFSTEGGCRIGVKIKSCPERAEGRSDRMMTVKKDKKERILQAAVDVIVGHGIESFSIRRLCRRSNLSIGLVYHHFKDKDAILHAVLEYYGISLLGWVRENVSAAKGDREKLKQKILDGFRIHRKQLSLVIILSNYFTRSFYSATEKQSTAALLSSYRTVLVKIIEQGVASGQFQVKNIDALAALILGSTLGINLQASVDPAVNTDAAAEMLTEMILAHITGAVK